MPEGTILVVDDERNIVQLARLYLASEGYQVESAYNGVEALEKAKTRSAGPGGAGPHDARDGWLGGLPPPATGQRRSSHHPNSAAATTRTRYWGWSLAPTTTSRSRSIQESWWHESRRFFAATERENRLRAGCQVGDIHIDLDRREVQVAGQAVTMRAKEFDLLAAFARYAGVVLDRERLLNLVWGYDYLGDSRTIDVHVTWLRDKISKSEDVRIQTVWGVGYKLVTEGREKTGVPSRQS